MAGRPRLTEADSRFDVALLKMAAMTSFHAERCCHLVSAQETNRTCNRRICSSVRPIPGNGAFVKHPIPAFPSQNFKHVAILHMRGRRIKCDYAEWEAPEGPTAGKGFLARGSEPPPHQLRVWGAL